MKYQTKRCWTNNNSDDRGFTLIELLIVIVIISVVIIVVIAAINPIEQLHKAQDNANLGNAENLMSAIDRYHATNDGEHPNIQIFTNSLL